MDVSQGKGASMDSYVALGEIKGPEKGKANEVIPVSVSEYEMTVVTFLLNQLVPKSSNSCSGIHKDDFTACCPDFDAGGVTAVIDVFLSGDGDGAP
jgi:hypothetical protein